MSTGGQRITKWSGFPFRRIGLGTATAVEHIGLEDGGAATAVGRGAARRCDAGSAEHAGPPDSPDRPSTGPSDAPLEAFDTARAVADAVLFEGYLLYPYRRSSGKNRVRWQFGVLAPRGWIEANGTADTSVSGSADAWYQQTDCLLEAADEAVVHVRLRFLQLQHRQLEARAGDGSFEPVDVLEVGGQRHLSFDEAVPREFDVAARVGTLREKPYLVEISVPGGEDVEPLGEPEVGRTVRRRWPVSARMRLSVTGADTPFQCLRLRLVTENTAASVAADALRPEALRASLVATHALLGVRGGSFLSLLDPPAWAAAAAKACRNVHAFPVLASEDREVLLSSPILLYDHPRVSPESPGDLFDATEIDEILSLRTLTLTEDEKREARATDPRAAAIVDRVDTIPREAFERLHGAVRSLRTVAPADGDDAPEGFPMPAGVPWWDPGGDESVSPETDCVIVGGVRVAKGSRVRLHPRQRGTDVHDMFLEGRTARVQAVLLDVDGARHVAVTLEDDPGADLHQWYGRFHYFAPDELWPLDTTTDHD